MAVTIGVDPHKHSHTAMVLDADEHPLGQVRVRASIRQVEQLVSWAAPFPDRTWAIEGAAGLGHLLAQQLVAVGERVVDVQPKLAARVRLLASGATNKNDPNDARSIAMQRCARATSATSTPRTIRLCCDCGPSDIATCRAITTRSPTDFTRHCPSLSPVAAHGTSPQLAPPVCSTAWDRSARSTSPATTSLESSSTTRTHPRATTRRQAADHHCVARREHDAHPAVRCRADRRCDRARSRR
jgi:hypothetical protein